MTGPLAGLRVVELEALGAVPHAAMMLADAGADVVRVARPSGPADADDLVARGRRGNAVTRSRRSITVDLKHPDGRTALLELVTHADVVLEGLRPGVAERLGVGPAECLAVNSALVYGRLTGWGRSGPLADRAGHDINYLALSGTLAPIGPSEDPPPVPLNLIADFGGGSMQLAFGVVAAVVYALHTGVGQVVDATMVDGAASLATYIHSMRAAGTWRDQREANVLDGGAPFYRTYATSDGRYVAVGAIEAQFYDELVAGLGLDPTQLPAQLDRGGWPRLRALFAERFASRSRDEWEQIFHGRDACVTPVLTMAEAAHHPHLRLRRTFVSVGGVLQPAPVPRFAATPSRPPSAPAVTGTGGLEAMVEWGLGRERVADWLASGAVTGEPLGSAEIRSLGRLRQALGHNDEGDAVCSVC